MNSTIPSGVGRVATKLAVAGVLFAAPVAAFGAPAFAATGFGGTPPAVLPAPPPADPPPPPPAPPAPPQQNAPAQQNYENPNDWYNTGADGGGGGGGGG
jgi:hypothetical protein